MYRPVHPLPDNPLDIIGDIHGEISALEQLLRKLGYDRIGNHPENRKLVFTGDLCDRGPDSPAVLAWFRQAYLAGNALMVLGNHELNLLTEDAKDGSGWFFTERSAKDAGLYAPWRSLPEQDKPALAEWLAEMPLVLARPDLRIVHAAWHPESIARLQTNCSENLIAQYRLYDAELKHHLETTSWYADYLEEQVLYAPAAENPDTLPPPMPASAQYELARSLMHPIRAVTSGIEQLAPAPFYASGRWRFTARLPWWEQYTDDTPVVIGHYWRSWNCQTVAANKNLLPAGNVWHGLKRNVFCVDYSVGARWRDRRANPPVGPEHSKFRLAALRWPEKYLVFDNGETAPTV